MILLRVPKNVILVKETPPPKKRAQGGGGFLAFGAPSRQIPTLSWDGGFSVDKYIMSIYFINLNFHCGRRIPKYPASSV